MTTKALSTIVFTAVFALLLATGPGAYAQAQSSPDKETRNPDTSWSSTSQSRDASGNTIPMRTSETHTVEAGRTVDKKSQERMGVDGRYVPFEDTEQESVRVNTDTVRTTTRVYGRDADGRKVLSAVTQEERRTLPGGEQKVVRVTSSPDLNGGMQIVKKEVEDIKQIGRTKEGSTTVFSPDVNGGMVATRQIKERQTQKDDHAVQFRSSTLIPDNNGGWTVGEVREGVVTEDGSKNQTREESVLRPNVDGRLSLVEKTVSKQSGTGTDEKRETVERYSTNVPGAMGGDQLSLDQRVTRVQRSRPGGGEVSEQKIEQLNPVAPGEGLRTTQKTIDIVRPQSGGRKDESRAIQMLDANGGFGVVWVDTSKKQESSATVNVDTGAGNAPSLQVDTKSSAKPSPAEAKSPTKPQ